MNWKIFLGTVGIIILFAGFGIWAVGWESGYPYFIMGAGLVALVVALGFSYRDLQEFAVKRSARYGLMSTAMSLIVVGILVLVALISQNHPARVDFSENQRFTLADQTVRILQGLQKPVNVVVFYNFLGGSGEPPQLRELLDEMKRKGGDEFSFEFIDPLKKPERAAGFEDELRRAGGNTPGSVTVFVTQESDTGENLQERAKGTKEPDITNAIIRLTRRHEARIYFLTGHDENEPDNAEYFGLSLLKQDLENLQYTTATFSFSQNLRVPDDCDVLVVAGPKYDLLPEQLEAVDNYIRRGGRVLFMVDAARDLPNLVSQLRAYGYDIKNDIVVEAVTVGDIRSIFTGQFRLVIDPNPTVGIDGYSQSSDITRGFKLDTRYFTARSVMTLPEKPQGMTLTKVVQTSSENYETTSGDYPGSWGESDVQAVMEALKANRQQTVKFNPGSDTRGPISLLTTVSINLDQYPDAAPPEDRVNDNEARIAVFGDSDFCTNRSYGPGQGEIAVNTVSWLAEKEDLISPELAKKTRNTSIVLTEIQKNSIVASVVALPLIIIIAGVLNAIRRRKFA